MKKGKVLYLDTFSGVSGDMILSALLDCGLTLPALKQEVSKLGVSGFRLSRKTVRRGGIKAVYLGVDLSKAPRFPHLSDMKKVLAGSSLDNDVKRQAVEVLELLAAAEAKVHGKKTSHVHFHELGDFDTLLDIVGALSGLKRLGVATVYASPIPLGRGFIKTDHGKMAAPAPATVEILRGVPVRMTDRKGELTTPTGAALIRTITKEFTDVLRMRIERIGYGAGARASSDLPNILRAFLGTEDTPLSKERVYAVETNIDDMDPQVYPHLFDRLLRAGAHDVYLTPVQMKKGRPGSLLTVIADSRSIDRVSSLLFSETTTIGLRFWEVRRRVSNRRMLTLRSSLGEVRVKEVDIPGAGVRRKIEFDDLVRISRGTGRSVIDIQRILSSELDLTGD